MALREILLFVTAAAFAASPRAQVYVVDAAGAGGAQFTSIATAAATVPDGATLVVRAGTYQPFTIDDKSLTVLADPGVDVYGFVSVEVENLSASRRVTIRGVELRGASTTGQLVCRDCAGTVVLDSVKGAPLFGGRFLLLRCDDVRATGCDLQPIAASALLCQDSDVRISSSRLIGATVSATVAAVDSTVELADVEVEGSGGFFGLAPIEVVGSHLRVLGTMPITSALLFGVTGPTIDGTGSVRIDPSVPLSEPIAAQLPVTTMAMPHVVASTAGAGGLATASMSGPAAGVGGLWLGFPGAVAAVPPFADAVLILAGTENLRALGPLASPLVAGYAVPPQPLLLGVAVTWQGASLDAAGGAQISNAVTYVHW